MQSEYKAKWLNIIGFDYLIRLIKKPNIPDAVAITTLDNINTNHQQIDNFVTVNSNSNSSSLSTNNNNSSSSSTNTNIPISETIDLKSADDTNICTMLNCLENIIINIEKNVGKKLFSTSTKSSSNKTNILLDIGADLHIVKQMNETCVALIKQTTTSDCSEEKVFYNTFELTNELISSLNDIYE
ncbi:unnamed protein product [Rotaria magnacalcarata]|uniref:Uncharacterized protein n=1 Tax=Rotaria magnacalcarata TaxID=392030 RepID=A0A816WLQ6_9BILA|nr:unnamed protein product [Rotaria magnacalcarata]CAF2136307.1 unnamed protein product [Rotaria magnacalcarata]CAF3792999.1 unnamed protein product [Rotaria magnacalcarata]CAF3873002.1 unnamed protein product [Rotaria magnacalcarata]CAF4977476.1 unnamed protein product [Rotaria magnacalcarata]